MNLDSIISHEKLEEMIIEKELTMKTIYDEFEIKENEIKTINFFFNSFILLNINNENVTIVDYKENDFFSFKYKNIILFHFLVKPIHTYIKKGDNLINVDFVHFFQFSYFNEKYSMIDSVFFCKDCDITLNNNFINLNEHKSHIEALFIKNKTDLEFLSKEEFIKFFANKEGKGFLGKTFSNAQEFELNFNEYFYYDKIFLNKKFIIWNDKENTRQKLCNLFLPENHINNFQKLYGFPNIGKSITLIGQLKYNTNHKMYATLYVNCKGLHNKKDKLNIKKILIKEIPFLFYNNYKDYKNCVEKIQDYSNNNDDTIWPLIDVILSTLIDNNKINFIVFDQYNSKSDPKNEIENICNKYLKKNKLFGFLTLSSINNTDIKELKVKHMLEINKESQDPENISEIKETFKLDLSIDNGGELDELLELFGYNLKIYNMLNLLKNNDKKEVNDFINVTKNYIKAKLKEFYKFDGDLSVGKLMLFSVYSIYTFEEFLNIYPFIHFKYFIPKIKINKRTGQREIHISYAYPIINDIINELYEELIYYTSQFYSILTSKILDGGAKGQFFEKLIINYLKPTSNEYINFFDDIMITQIEEIDKFIPKKNETKWKKKKIIKKNLNFNTTYLFIQKNFNGKCIDLLIVEVNETKSVKVIALQISIYKNNIYSNIMLQLHFNTMIEYITFHYDIEIKKENIFFSYIFDLPNKDNEKIKNLISNCKNNKIAYFFFDIKKKQFVDDFGKKISEIGEKVKSPFNLKRPYPYLENILEDDKLETVFGKKEYKVIALTNEQRNKIIQIINSNSSNSVKEIKYVKTSTDYSKVTFNKNNFIIVRLSNNDIILSYLANDAMNSLIINEKGYINKGMSFNQSNIEKIYQYEEYDIIFNK